MTTERQYLDIPFEIKAADIADDGTFEGWGSLFDNEPDAHRDLIARNTFVETLAKGGRNKTGIAMLWQHRTDKLPGVWLELSEDPKGLRVKGQLALETQLGREVHEIMKLGAKTGTWKFSLSIGYDTLEYEMQTIKVGDAKIKVRLIKKAELWEISIVTFPAKIGATVTNVKKVDIERLKEVKTERELEKILREAGAFSDCGLKLLVKMCKPFLREAVKGEVDTLEDAIALSTILDSLKAVNKNMEMVDILGHLKGIN